jgi:hypothetical protein
METHHYEMQIKARSMQWMISIRKEKNRKLFSQRRGRI